MTSRRPPLPVRVADLVAGGLVVILGLVALLATGLLVPASAHAAAPPGDTAEPDDVFTATIERIERDPGPVGRPTRYTYTVQVQEVYGESDISSVRVRVQTSSSFGACLTRPDVRGSARYLWKATRQGPVLQVNGCRDVLRVTDDRVAAATTTYGEPHSPTEPTPSTPQVEFPDVAYTCPTTSEAISDVGAAETSCDEIAVPQSFDRAAAPGLALILIGFLGYVVVLRLGRSRRS